MRVERLFSSRSLRPAPGVYDAGGADATAGALSALRQTEAARSRSASRIQAAHDTYTRGLVNKAQAKRSLVNSTANLGVSLAGVAQSLYRRQEAQRRNDAVENGFLAVQQMLSELADRSLAAGGSDPEAVVGRFDQGFAEGFDHLTRDMAPEVRDAIMARVNGILPMERAEVLSRATRQADEAHRAELGNRAIVRAARAIDSNEPRRQIMEMQAFGSDVAVAVMTGVLTPEEGERWQHLMRGQVWRHVAEGWSRNDPSHAVRLLDEGHFDHLFANEDEKAEARSLIAAAAKALGVDDVRAKGRQRRLENALITLRNGGEVDPALARDLADHGTAEQRRILRQAERRAAMVREYRERFRYLPPSEQVALLQRDGRLDDERRAAVDQARLRDLVEWADDPVLVAAAHPASGTLHGLMDVQRRKGIPQPALYTKAKAAEIVAALHDASPAQRGDILRQQRQLAASEMNALLRDLGAAGLGAGDRLRLQLGDQPQSARLLRDIEAAENTDLKDLRGGIDKEALAVIDRSLEPALAPYLDSMAPALEGAGLAEQRDDFVRLARKLALVLVLRGHQPRRAVDRTVAALFADRYELVSVGTGASLRIPRRHDSAMVRAHAEALRGQPLADFGPDPEVTGADLPRGTTVKQWQAELAKSGRFTSMPDDEGAVLLTADGLPVRDAVGKTFGFSFAEVLDTVSDREGPDASSKTYREFVRRILWSQQAGNRAPRPSASKGARLWQTAAEYDGLRLPEAAFKDALRKHLANDDADPVPDEEAEAIADDTAQRLAHGAAVDPGAVTAERSALLLEAILELSAHPDRRDRVLQEIHDIFGAAALVPWSSMPRVKYYATMLAKGRTLDERQLAQLSQRLTPENIAKERERMPELHRQAIAAMASRAGAGGRQAGNKLVGGDFGDTPPLPDSEADDEANADRQGTGDRDVLHQLI